MSLDSLIFLRCLTQTRCHIPSAQPPAIPFSFSLFQTIKKAVSGVQDSQEVVAPTSARENLDKIKIFFSSVPGTDRLLCFPLLYPTSPVCRTQQAGFGAAPGEMPAWHPPLPLESGGRLVTPPLLDSSLCSCKNKQAPELQRIDSPCCN